MPVLKSAQDFLRIAIEEIKSRTSNVLTDFYEGSVQDILLGGIMTGVEEAQALMVQEFKKTFFDTANGPEVTGGVDDLENLAVDHYGSDFARPPAQEATGIVTFSRASTGAGNVTIAAGTIVKTEADANGQTQSFEVISPVTMTGLTINASVRAVEAGTAGNVEADTVVVIETTLTDPTVEVTNDDAFTGGAAEEDDATYRETIRNLIAQLRGATLAAIRAKALTVSGVEQATGLTVVQNVIEWDVDDESSIGEAFKIVRARLYIADANGTASDALVELVEDAIESVQAFGVKIEVLGAEALEVDWTATISLNPSGPNYATLVSDPSLIEEAMEEYIQQLAIGADFVRTTARTYILSQWGPSGTNDLTDFVITVPSGDVVTSATQKLVPGNVEVA
jgi:hypothetical protein